MSGFWIVEYSLINDSGLMVALRYQAYYVPVLPNYLRIISPIGIQKTIRIKVTFVAHWHDEHDIYEGQDRM